MKTGKRLLAILLSVGMILTTGPGFVLAEEIAGTDTGGNAAVTDTVSNNVVRSEATDTEDSSAAPQNDKEAAPQKDNANDVIQSEAKDPEDSSAAPQKDEGVAPQNDNAGDVIQSEAKDPKDSSAELQNDKEAASAKRSAKPCHSEARNAEGFPVKSPGAHTRVRPYRYVGYVSHVPVGADPL